MTISAADKTFVDRGTLHPNRFFTQLSQRLTLSAHYAWSDCDEVFYLGGGYWRVKPIYKADDDNTLVGATLINPDRTPEELSIITKAMNILI